MPDSDVDVSCLENADGCRCSMVSSHEKVSRGAWSSSSLSLNLDRLLGSFKVVDFDLLHM